jgi:hypothetical protein
MALITNQSTTGIATNSRDVNRELICQIRIALGGSFLKLAE